MALGRALKNPYADTLPEVTVAFDDAGWAMADLNAESGPVAPLSHAAFRTRFTVAPEALASSGYELWFGKLEGNTKVYLNGEMLGLASDPRSPAIFSVKGKLHPGENTLVVTLANYYDTAGVNKGVALRLVDNPPHVLWSRSVFNGLAQVVVQSSKQAGTLKLTARAEGLRATTVLIEAQPAVLRPALP